MFDELLGWHCCPPHLRLVRLEASLRVPAFTFQTPLVARSRRRVARTAGPARLAGGAQPDDQGPACLAWDLTKRAQASRPCTDGTPFRNANRATNQNMAASV